MATNLPSQRRARIRSNAKFSSSLYYETLEARQVLSAYFPAYASGEFTLGNPASDAPYGLDQTFFLESNPGASKTIFLDFNGHISRNNSWGHDIAFPAFNFEGSSTSFSVNELTQIQQQFQNVAEDFLPFDVNVTTRDPGVAALTRTSFFDQTYGIRVLNTQPTDGFGNGSGGVAFLNSFNDSVDNPAFVFNKGANAGAQTNSHEAGHALGLFHDGLDGREYHPGTGSGETSWGPILGAPFRSNITQWSNGDYEGSTNNQDDLTVITSSSNGFGFRDDDHGSSIATASALDLNENGTPFDYGIIERNTDRDFYEFSTTGGNVQLNIDAFGGNPNLDILARLIRSDGTIIAASNQASTVDAAFNNINLDAGTYYLSVEGTGRDGRYSDYGSLGFYTITGQIPGAGEADAVQSAIGQAGRVRINHNWTTVELNQSFQDPVVVAGPASRFGGDPVTVRVQNVTADSFQIRIDEWEYRDGNHGFEWVDFLVVESGTHQLEDGTLIQAGNASNQTHGWKSYDLGPGFDSTPVVVSQTVTTNENVAVTTRLRNVTSDGFDLRIQEEQASDYVHTGETIGWIAIETGIADTGDGLFEAFQTPNSVSHRNYVLNFQNDFNNAPIFVGSLQTYNGGDTGTLRYRHLSGGSSTVFVEEERSADSEILHNPEVVGYVALEHGTIFGTSQGNSPVAPGGGDPFADADLTPTGDTTFDSRTSFDEWYNVHFNSQAEPGYEFINGLPSDFGHNHSHDHNHDHSEDGNQFDGGHVIVGLDEVGQEHNHDCECNDCMQLRGTTSATAVLEQADESGQFDQQQMAIASTAGSIAGLETGSTIEADLDLRSVDNVFSFRSAVDEFDQLAASIDNQDHNELLDGLFQAVDSTDAELLSDVTDQLDWLNA